MNISRRERNLFTAFLVSVIALCIHMGALRNFWYWRYYMTDIGVHFLVGLALGLLIFSLPFINKKYLFALSSVLSISFAWEIFELVTGTTFASGHLVLDTISDTLSALIGASVAVYFAEK